VATVWADTIETLAALGDVELARVYLEQYERNARRFKSPEATAAALRCRSLLAASEGHPDDAVAAARSALDELEGYAYPFERARVLLALGSALRSSHQKAPARATLEEALTIFEGLGARLWAEKARVELLRISGRRAAAPDDLTDAERAVAELAGNGHSNKQIAASLHMAVSTVEAHLSRVYRKLDVHRAELATRLAEMDADALRRAPTPRSP
jgi:DNA-binding NarL/FixJ family response regulator